MVERTVILALTTSAFLVTASVAAEDSWNDWDQSKTESYRQERGTVEDLEDNDEWLSDGEDADTDDLSGPDRFTIYDDKRKRVQQLRKNNAFDGQYDIYDEKGRREGRVRKSTLSDDRYDVYDNKGRRTQQLRGSPVIDGQYDIYDEKGRRVGRVKKRSYSDDTYDVYDNKGRRIRTIEGD